MEAVNAGVRLINIQQVEIDLSLPVSIRICDGATAGDPYRCYTPAGIFDLPMSRQSAAQMLTYVALGLAQNQHILMIDLLSSSAWTQQ